MTECECELITPAVMTRGVIISRYMTRTSDQYRTDTRIKHAPGITVKLYEWHRECDLCHQNISERDIILMNVENT